MELFGKVVSPKREATLNLNGYPELLVNAKSGRVTLSASLLEKLNCAEAGIGFGYDPAKEIGNHTAYLYILANAEEGCKVGNGGAVTTKWHAEKLQTAFTTANRFKLDVDTENPISFQDTLLYPISFKADLPDLTRSKSTEEPSLDAAVVEQANA
jgi:hypothetical protein